jgi:hypothetical protein
LGSIASCVCIIFDKNRLYAHIGIPEFWRFNGNVLSIYQLVQGTYEEVERSPTFPWLQKAMFYQFLQQSKTEGEAQALRTLKEWLAGNRC